MKEGPELNLQTRRSQRLSDKKCNTTKQKREGKCWGFTRKSRGFCVNSVIIYQTLSVQNSHIRLTRLRSQGHCYAFARVFWLVFRPLSVLESFWDAYKNEHPHFDGLWLHDWVVQFNLIIVSVRFSWRCDIHQERKRNGEREVSLWHSVSGFNRTRDLSSYRPSNTLWY